TKARWLSTTRSRPDGVENDIDIVPFATAAGPRAAEVAREDGRERAIVGEIEIAERGDGDVELDRIDARPEGTLRHAASPDVAEECDEGAVQLAHLLRFPQMPRAVQVLVVDQTDQLGMSAGIVEAEFDQPPDGGLGREMRELEGPFGPAQRLVDAFQRGEIK